jgi:hypothetical protein
VEPVPFATSALGLAVLEITSTRPPAAGLCWKSHHPR